MILVYQMGKVASRSWHQAICAADPAGESMHVHHLAAVPRARLARILELPPPDQTIANLIMPREQQRKGTAALAQIDACRRGGKTIRVVTGIRDPVARSISLLMFMADFYGHKTRPLSIRNSAAPDYLRGVLGEIWESVFTDLEPAQGFEWIARHAIGVYRTWFAEELEAVFGVDVLSAPFPAGGPQRLSGPGVEVLAYRAEDMDPAAASHRELLAQATEFLGLPVSTFPETNTAATRRSWPLYSAVRERFRLPKSLVDAIYDDKVARHFYAPAEIAAFKARWREAAA